MTHAVRAPVMWVKKFYEREKVVTLPNGKRARIHIDDSGTVKHTETDDTLDATVRPRALQVRIETRSK